MNDVFRAAEKKKLQNKSMGDESNRDLDLTPRAKSGWNCFQCCFPAKTAAEHEPDATRPANGMEEEENEEKQEAKSRDLELPPEMDEVHESVEAKPQPQEQQPPANFVIAFWQLFMTVFLAHFLQNKPKKLSHEPANTPATTSTTTSTSKKES